MGAKRPLLATLSIFVSAGCGGGGGGRSSAHAVRFDVGGFVAYEGAPTVGLAGVVVTLVDSLADSHAATTGSNGLWTIEGVDPGVYTERYELAGYEAVTGAFALEAFGENDVSNPFVARPAMLLTEMRATFFPFGLQTGDGQEVHDGVGGTAASYSIGDAEDVEIELSFPCASGFAIVDDTSTGDFVVANLDSGNMKSFRILGAEIEALNGGSGITPTSGATDWNRVRVTVTAYTPIYGELVSLESAVWFSTSP